MALLYYNVIVFICYVYVVILLLKKFQMKKRFRILGLLFCLTWFISFWYCYVWYVDYTVHTMSVGSHQSFSAWSTPLCFKFSNQVCFDNLKIYSTDDMQPDSLVDISSYSYVNGMMLCIPAYYRVLNDSSTSCSFPRQLFDIIDNVTSCDNYTSEECQQEYSLMPVSSCNSEYCWLNWLCPEYTWSIMSELYINWINHLSAPIISLTIPLEQYWDYEYTGDTMYIDISWENNVDYEYIDNIIRTQNSKPNAIDFNNIISWLVPLFVPWLVIILLILFIFRFIKKIF